MSVGEKFSIKLLQSHEMKRFSERQGTLCRVVFAEAPFFHFIKLVTLQSLE